MLSGILKMASDSSSSSDSSPNVSNESKGSSVSTTFREEYEDLLRYAVVTPKFDGKIKGVLMKSNSTVPVSGPGAVEVSHLDEEEEEKESITEGEESQHSVPPPLNNRHNYLSQSPSHVNHAPPPHLSHTPLPSTNHSELLTLEGQLDHWYNDMKRNVLADFEQALIRAREHHRMEMAQELDRLSSQQEQLQSQLDRTKSLLLTYEQSVHRKDQIIQSLTKSLQKQKDRVGLVRSFAVWRTKHNDDKREAFVSSIARKHYCTQLKGKVIRKWFGVIQVRWKERVKKACQMRAEEVCRELKGRHDEEMNKVLVLLEEKQQQVNSLCKEREMFGENMKKAFMRGVCALNMETMTVFNQPVELSCHDNHAPPTPQQYDIEGGEGGKREPRIRIEKHLH